QGPRHYHRPPGALQSRPIQLPRDGVQRPPRLSLPEGLTLRRRYLPRDALLRAVASRTRSDRVLARPGVRIRAEDGAVRRRIHRVRRRHQDRLRTLRGALDGEIVSFQVFGSTNETLILDRAWTWRWRASISSATPVEVTMCWESRTLESTSSSSVRRSSSAASTSTRTIVVATANASTTTACRRSCRTGSSTLRSISLTSRTR
ncbi:hypothetical protein AAVH_42083, partial [Aphelenchoides avenae]